MSITDELRDAMSVSYGHVSMKATRFAQLCDAIDAIHVNLERENESLRRELDRLMGEQDRDGWIELPKDADGELICVGDELEVGNGKREKVKFMTLCTGGSWLINERGWVPIRSHHVKPDTWERIIEDAVNLHFNPSLTSERDALIARCKALAGN